MEKEHFENKKLNFIPSEMIKNRRKALKLNCSDVGDFIGVSNTYVSKIENGVTKSLVPEKIFKLKEILQLNELEFEKLVLYFYSPNDEKLIEVFKKILKKINKPQY